MKYPRVSILLPFFNAEQTLGPAIRSIIQQSYPHWELILIDDGSTDHSLEKAKRFDDSRIKIVADGRNLKLPRRLNQGVKISRGRYIARMDADDVTYPDRIETQLQFLERNPQIDVVASRVDHIQCTGKDRGNLSLPADACRHLPPPLGRFLFSPPDLDGQGILVQTQPIR